MRELIDLIEKSSDKSEALKILKLMLKIDNLCDKEEEMGEFLPRLLHQMAQYLDADTAAIMLREENDSVTLRDRYDKGGRIITQENLVQVALEAVRKNDWIIEENSKRPKISNLIATPVRKLDRVLGAFVIANKSTGPFTDSDKRSVSVVEARVDQVLDKYLREKKSRRLHLENELMKEIDRIRHESSNYSAALDRMVGKVLDTVQAQIGFIFLYNKDESKHILGGRMLRGPKALTQNDYDLVKERARTTKEIRKTLIEGRIKESEIDSIICSPMFMGDRYLGCVTLVNKEDGGQFDYDDIHLAETTASMIDSFIYEEERHKRLVMLVGQAATRDIEESMIGSRPDNSEGKREIATMLFADIRNYSTTTKDMDPNTVVRMLNDFFNKVTPIIFKHNGMVDKYVGDEIVALFRDDPEKGLANAHAMNAVAASLSIQEELATINKEWDSVGRPRVNIGIGIHTGEVIIGQIGSQERKDYTAIGANMNYAARLQSLAKGGEVIISESTYLGTNGRIAARQVGPYEIKGFGQVHAYKVEGYFPDSF